MFIKAKQNRIFQDVVDQIQEAIVSGKLKAGDQLPAERELKDTFNISRGTLREALRVLEQKGLIEIRTGVSGGSIVKGITTEQMSESLGLLIRYKKVPLGKLAEFRESMEGIVASLAAQRATAQDVVRLRLLLERAGQCLKQGADHWDEFIRIDEELHLALAEIADNVMFSSVLQTVYHNIHIYYESYLSRDETTLQENFQDLSDIVQAVDQRQSDKALTLAEAHVSRFNDYMEARLARKLAQ